MTFPLRPTATASLLLALAACSAPAPPAAPASGRAPVAALPDLQAASEPALAQLDGGPDEDERLYPPDGYHGSWRVVAADDPHRQALMAIGIQSSVGLVEGSGDYVLFQPFCDAVAERPIRGDADCELIGLSAAFDRVEADAQGIVLVFHPTADGFAHRLELRREGSRLAGHYVVGDDGSRREIVAEPRGDIR